MTADEEADPVRKGVVRLEPAFVGRGPSYWPWL